MAALRLGNVPRVIVPPALCEAEAAVLRCRGPAIAVRIPTVVERKIALVPTAATLTGLAVIGQVPTGQVPIGQAQIEGATNDLVRPARIVPAAMPQSISDQADAKGLRRRSHGRETDRRQAEGISLRVPIAATRAIGRTNVPVATPAGVVQARRLTGVPIDRNPVVAHPQDNWMTFWATAALRLGRARAIAIVALPNLAIDRVRMAIDRAIIDLTEIIGRVIATTTSLIATTSATGITELATSRNSRDLNVGDVNIGNSVNYQDNRQAWVNNRHRVGNDVRVNAGNRYANSYRDGRYRRGVTGGYAYNTGWANRGGFYGWRAPTYAAVGGFLGASFANAQPVYYGYGDGGNVYYEDNTVYVDGQPAGTPEEYAQQAYDYVAAAPPADQVNSEDWLPLGVFAFTREDVADSQAMIELAVDKQGVLAGTYYNDETGVSRPLKGTVDSKSQRAVVGFADDDKSEVALETGIYNLTKDEAPGLLHRGTEESQPVLLVRLPAPEDGN